MIQELHPEAEIELLEAAQWYGERSFQAGINFVAAIEFALGVILESPERFQRVGAVRVYRLDRFPYKIYYEWNETRQHVRVLCIMHNKRRPDYWRNRVASGSAEA